MGKNDATFSEIDFDFSLPEQETNFKEKSYCKQMGDFKNWRRPTEQCCY